MSTHIPQQSNSPVDIASALNFGGATLKNCTLDARSAGMVTTNDSEYEDCNVIKLTSQSPPLQLSGHCKNLRVESDGGTVNFAPGTIVDGLDLSGERLTIQMGDDVKCSNINAENTSFITFACGDNVSITNSNFENSIFSCCDLNANSVMFSHCNFSGAHLNPSFAGATIDRCVINEETRLDGADWHACHITDLRLSKEDGTSQYIRNMSELEPLGAAISDRAVTLSPQAQIREGLASVTGGQSCDDPTCSPNLPNAQEKSADISRFT
jgi:uncharacterized protein YjbI with pentapeptide repeats